MARSLDTPKQSGVATAVSQGASIIGTNFQMHDGVAVITLDNPPLNGLNHELRAGLVAGIDQASADAGVKAVIIIGAGRAFSSGADIREFNTPKSAAEPTLGSVIRVVEANAKPVIAAISGICMGGGLELALGCHFRVASPGAKIALPEVKLGLLPGAGGTQRLPRAIGVEAALNMIVSGAPGSSEQFKGTRLIDEIIDGTLLENELLPGALAFARQVVAERRPLARLRDVKIDFPNADAFFQFARNSVGPLAKNFPAPLKCIDAVAAAVTRPFDEGLKLEREFFMHLVQTLESRALRHAFFAERAAAKIPDVPENTPARKLASVAVIGAGTMGGGIAMNFLSAGFPVTILEMKQEALDKGVATIGKNYEASVKRGKLTADNVERNMGLLKPTLSY